MTQFRLARRLPALAAVVLVPLVLAACATNAPKLAANAPVTLKFGEIFKMPVGPKGLEPTDATLALDGKRVRVVGYAVAQPPGAALILSPLPVAVGDDDEGLADDVPPTAVAVHSATARALPDATGLVEVVGTLGLGTRQDPVSGRVSSIHVVADPKSVKSLHPAKTDGKHAASTKANPLLVDEK
ncbi:MAG TPA: hypothetical protein VJ724_09805 [Tahibacter sp.]|nr:hypothetical protein [Tahibacter sp.]